MARRDPKAVNPLIAEFDGTVTTVDTVYGSQTNTALGSWKVEGTEIIAKYARGYVEYTLTAPTNDSYRILIEATHDWLKMTCSPVSPIDNSDLEIYLDGQYLGTKKLVAPDGIYGDVRIFTPYIAPGEHTIRIYWENVHTRIALRIKQLHLQALGGPDSDNDGVKDWVDASIGNTTGLDATAMATNAAGQFVSVVSPVCLEGPARYVDMMSCTIGTNNVPVNHGAGDSWYLDADLSATGPTAINLSFLDDAVSVVTNVTWVPLDLLTADDMRIRKNDSVMFNVQPSGQTNGTVNIAITQGATPVTNITTTLDQPVAYRFDAAGSYTVTGVFSNQAVVTNSSMTVDVVEGSFPTNPPSCLIGTQRTWACPGMPNGVIIESDNTVALTFTNGVMRINMLDVNGTYHAVARLYEAGPILASTPLVPYWAQGNVDGYLWVTESYEDSELWQNRMIFKNLPDNVDIKVSVVTSGVTLDDSTLERWLTKADLDELGQYDIGLIVPKDIDSDGCHRVQLYQDGVYLGEAYFAETGMPGACNSESGVRYDLEISSETISADGSELSAPAVVCVGSSVTFSAVVGPAEYSDYTYDFAFSTDGQADQDGTGQPYATACNAIYTWSEPGTYTVTLNVWDSEHDATNATPSTYCENTTTFEVSVVTVGIDEIASLPNNTLALNNIYVAQSGTVEVLKDWKNRYKGAVDTTLAGMTYKWERRPNSGGAWSTIGTTKTLEYSEATVGDFDVRFVVSVGGHDWTSDDRRVKVCEVEQDSFTITEGNNYTNTYDVSGNVLVGKPSPGISFTGKLKWKTGSPTGTKLREYITQSIDGDLHAKWSYNGYFLIGDMPPATPVSVFTWIELVENVGGIKLDGHTDPVPVGTGTTNQDTPGHNTDIENGPVDNCMILRRTSRSRIWCDFVLSLALRNTETDQAVPIKQQKWYLHYDTDTPATLPTKCTKDGGVVAPFQVLPSTQYSAPTGFSGNSTTSIQVYP